MRPGNHAVTMNARFRETPGWSTAMWTTIKEYFERHPELA